MVTTYALEPGGSKLQRVGEAATMNMASAALPPGAYTTFRTYHRNRVLRLGQHLRRLEESAALMNVAATIDDEKARWALSEVLRLTGNGETRFRLTFAPPALYISEEPFTAYPPVMYQEGVWCVTVTTHRNNPHAKSTAFIASAGDAYKMLPPGVHEGLMVDRDGAILEGLSSNFFAMCAGALHTEQARALIGVTQSLALEVAQRVMPDLPLATSAIALSDLPNVSECFITSVSREVMPVVKVDEQVIGEGSPGVVTRALIAGLYALIEDEAEPL